MTPQLAVERRVGGLDGGGQCLVQDCEFSSRARVSSGWEKVFELERSWVGSGGRRCLVEKRERGPEYGATVYKVLGVVFKCRVQSENADVGSLNRNLTPYTLE